MRQHRRMRPRDDKGRFLKVIHKQTAEEKATMMATLYQWRDLRREYDEQLIRARRDERFIGLRSLMIFAAISAVMVGVLAASVA